MKSASILDRMWWLPQQQQLGAICAIRSKKLNFCNHSLAGSAYFSLENDCLVRLVGTDNQIWVHVAIQIDSTRQ